MGVACFMLQGFCSLAVLACEPVILVALASRAREFDCSLEVVVESSGSVLSCGQMVPVL